MQTNDRQITELMESINSGKAQLPDFQRGWVWDDDRIKALIASVTCDFPVGAAMFLQYGNADIRFKYRLIEGSPATNTTPDELILDGQQRLTSLYSSLFNKQPVRTRTEKNKDVDIYRYYYIDIKKAIDTDIDRIDAILSVPADSKKITSDFGRNVILDLSTQEMEFKNRIFPLNIILDYAKAQEWQNKYYAYYNYDPQVIQQFTKFNTEIVIPTMQYKMPVIQLDKKTPKEAVCQVFENVNTGGVSLTVFELVTAVFAMDDFELRKDWDERKEKYFNGDILFATTATDLLTACTLLSTYKKGGTVSCKKKDVLNLTLNEYKQYADVLSNGFVEAEKLLQEERIFSERDLPYTTQLIPLAVICSVLSEDKKLNIANVKNKVKQWYWCGVFGEMYGGANETRYVYDVVDVLNWINNGDKLPRTIQDSYFNPIRLLSLQSRQSAAYKGVMALIFQNHCADFISGRAMDFTLYKSDGIDIHHIFPKDYCINCKYDKRKWNSVVNKTPLSYSTNREIGGVAPSKYLSKIENKGQVTPSMLNIYLESHFIDVSACRSDDFDTYFTKRAISLLDAIEKATGKPISGRKSEEVIKEFGSEL